MLIFVHIPKSAGTSFKGLLKKIYKPSEIIVVDSDGWYKDMNYSVAANRTNLPGAQQIQPPASVKCITGHFNASCFVNLYPNADYITWVRDPIQRMISHYNYYLRIGAYYGQIAPTKRSYDIIDLETYATHSYNVNFMTQLINIPLTKFKFIGIVEKYDEEIKRFKETFGIDINEESQHYNLNPEKKSVQETYNVSDEQKEKLMKLHAEDYKLYNECLKLAGYN